MKSSQEPMHSTNLKARCWNRYRLFFFFSRMYVMHLDHTCTSVPSHSLAPSSSQVSLLLHVSRHVFFSNGLTLIRAAYVSLGVGLFTGVRATYQWPRHCRNMTHFPPVAIGCQQLLSKGWGLWAPAPPMMEGLRLVHGMGHSFCEFVSVKTAWNSPHSHPLTLTLLLFPLPSCFLSLRRSDINVLFGTEQWTQLSLSVLASYESAPASVFCNNTLP